MNQARYPRMLTFDGSNPIINGFVKQTYNYFMQSIVLMLLVGVGAYYLLPEKAFMSIMIADSVLWVFCGWFGWRNPIGFVLPMFAIVTGAFLGLLAERYVHLGLGSIFVNASVITVIAFAALSFYVHTTRKNFNFLIGFLIAGFWILLGGFALSFRFQQPLYQIGLSSFGALVFSAWILFDTSRIIHQDDPTLTPAIASFELFLDIVGLHSYILDLASFDAGDLFEW